MFVVLIRVDRIFKWNVRIVYFGDDGFGLYGNVFGGWILFCNDSWI